MKKTHVAKLLERLPGFRKLGFFYIGECNGEVVSGYALDAPPGGVYVWRFVLPAYDRVNFLHMGLGKRIASLSASDEPAEGLNLTDLDVLLRNDWNEFSRIHDAGSLLDYVEQEQCVGEYSEWTKYIAHIRAGSFDIADLLELQWRKSGWIPRVPIVVEGTKAVLTAKKRSGWLGVQDLLQEWSTTTVSKYCQ